jgi:hypothetical protein
MVTAGVHPVARCTPLFEHVPNVQMVVASIGGFTALLAALIALTQTDLSACWRIRRSVSSATCSWASAQVRLRRACSTCSHTPSS